MLPRTDWVTDELTKNEKESRIDDVDVSPPLCIAVQIALTRLLRSWGIKPMAITSHSSGEIAAAYAAGVLSLQEAMAIVHYARGQFLDALWTKADHRGSMMAVGLGREDAEPYLSKLSSGKVVVACVNSPSSVTVSGDQAAIAELEQQLTEEKVFARMLNVRVAYHSHHMNAVAADYRKALPKTIGKKHTFKDNVLYSSPTTGGRITDAADMGPEHWVTNLLQPVEFLDAFRSICRDQLTGEKQVDMLLEVGPHGALAGPIRQCLQLPELKDLGVGYLSCLNRGENAVDTMHALAVSLVARGYRVNLNAVNFPHASAQPKIIPNLPTYPWNHRTRHWSEPRINKEHRLRKKPAHELLGSTIPGASPSNQTWRHTIRTSDLPWVRDHRVQSDMVYPGAGLIVMAIEAMRQVNHSSAVRGFSLRDVDIVAALVIPDTPDGVEVQLHLHQSDGRTLGLEGWRPFSICSTDGDGGWTTHCKGLISATLSDMGGVVAPGDDCTVKTKPDDMFEFLQSVGIYHGPAFRNLKKIMSAEGASAATFAVADTAASMPGGYQQEHLLHPTTLDSVFVAAYSALPRNKRSAAMPRSIKRMSVSADIGSRATELFVAHSRIGKADGRGFHADIAVRSEGDAGSSAVLEIEGLFCQTLAETAGQAEQHNGCLTIKWEEDLSLTSAHGLMERLKARPDPAEIAHVQELKQACFYFFHDAVTSLTEADVGSLLWYHKTFFEWMKLQISQQPQAATWLDVDETEREELIGKVSSASVDGEMACLIGRNLNAILRQQVAPLELMLKDHLLHRYYKHALRIDRCYAQVRHLVSLFAHKNPRARVLEIGAGTGGCTQIVLEALGGGDTDGGARRFSHYDYTDISSGFFEQARSRFGAWDDEGAMRFRKFDVEGDPADQGFEEGSYDLVVACQVLHATKNMDRTMQHVRSLLKPGGKLVMVEMTHDVLDVQLIFGVLPGWWLST